MIKNLYSEAWVIHLNQDDFYFDDRSSHHVTLPQFNNHINWELHSAFDMKKMTQITRRSLVKDDLETNCSLVDSFVLENEEIKSVKKNPNISFNKPIVIVEGITIFHELELLEMMDLKCFITLDYERCKSRRERRSYEPWDDPKGYFDEIVWPSYTEYESKINHSNVDVLYFTGSDTYECILNKIINAINKTILK